MLRFVVFILFLNVVQTLNCLDTDIVNPDDTSFIYYSQFKQDRFINETFFKGKRNGIFVDIGAHNGVTHSNSYFFEKYLNWQGICAEPLPSIFLQLQENRKCICLNQCITDYNGVGKFFEVPGSKMLSGLVDKFDPRHLKRIHKHLAKIGGELITRDVQCQTFNDTVTIYNFNHIDLLSVDTEGGEFDILKNIDFDNIFIDVITVEVNYKNDTRIRNLLEKKGFVFIKRLGVDEVYKHS